jgi:hypothetical protein
VRAAVAWAASAVDLISRPDPDQPRHRFERVLDHAGEQLDADARRVNEPEKRRLLLE